MSKLHDYCLKVISQCQDSLSYGEVFSEINVDLSKERWGEYFSEELYAVSCYGVNFRLAQETKIKPQ